MGVNAMIETIWNFGVKDMIKIMLCQQGSMAPSYVSVGLNGIKI